MKRLLKRGLVGWLSVLLLVPAVGIGQTSTQNYIQQKRMTNASGTSSLTQIDYYDGLGNLSETVIKNGGLSNQDLVTLYDYDNNGRLEKTWLPAVRSGNNGGYVAPSTVRSAAVTDNLGDTKPYSLTVYENAPTGRVEKVWGPGATWHSADNTSTRTAYLTNSTSSSKPELRCLKYRFEGSNSSVTLGVTAGDYYPSGQLYVTRTIDEDGRTGYHFTDKQGVTLLTRSVSGNDLFDTYYIYDNYGNLRAVLPPELSAQFTSGSYVETRTIIKQYAFLYKYDKNRRCTAKKLPGADWVYYVYDKTDRLIYTQDGEQRTRGEWSFTIPDAFGRTVLTGVCNKTMDYNGDPLVSTVVRATPNTSMSGGVKGYTVTPSLPSGYTLHAVYYYDAYDFLGKNGFPAWSALNASAPSGYTTGTTTAKKGMPTGEMTAVLGTSNFLCTTYHYDNRDRVIQKNATIHLGGVDNEFAVYHHDGLPEKRYLRHKKTSSATALTEEYVYAYDHARRPTTVRHKYNTGAQVVLSEKTYDKFGRVSTETLGGRTDLKATHQYNVRSWLTQTQGTHYKDEAIGYSPGGNIIRHQNYSHYRRRYFTYEYDALSRITSVGYTSNSTDPDPHDCSYEYDKNGNLTRIVRAGRTGSVGVYGPLDNLTFVYEGNQVKKVTDAVKRSTVTYLGSQDFKDYDNKDREYRHNLNGAAVMDLNRGVDTILYNALNLPSLIEISSPVAEARNTYLYSTDGRKLQLHRRWNPDLSVNPPSGSGKDERMTSNESTDYIGNKVYVGGTLKRVLTDKGYIEEGVYHYYVKDYLGSNRAVVNSSGTMLQYINYYPFGMKLGDSNGMAVQQYRYTGKEIDEMHGLNLYDYIARFYDPSIGRFLMIDPLAEKYYSVSPYAYCLNNPMIFVDYRGDSVSVAGMQGLDQVLGTNYVGQITSDLQAQTGLTITVSSDGKMSYARDTNGKPIISTTTDANGNTVKVGSATARSLMMGAIDHQDRVSVSPGAKSGVPSGTNTIGLNFGQIEGFVSGAVGVTPKTLGWGMTLMHEMHHTQVGGGLRDTPGNPGPVVSQMNIIRSELNATGVNYGQRIEYGAKHVGSYNYIPFSISSQDALRGGLIPGAMPAEKFVRFK